MSNHSANQAKRRFADIKNSPKIVDFAAAVRRYKSGPATKISL